MTKNTLLKSIDASAGAALCRLCGLLPGLALNNENASVPDPADVKRILVIRPGGMGDMIVLLPVLRRLCDRFPAARIDLTCETRNLGVVRLAALPLHPLAYDRRPGRFLHRLCTQAYDVVIDTEQFHHASALFALLSRAPVRIGFNINPRRNPLYTHLIHYAPDGKECDQFMRLLAPLGIEGSAPPLAGFLANAAPPVTPGCRDALQRLGPGRSAAVLHVGTSTRYKVWPAAHFVELAGELHRRHGHAIVLVGDRGDTTAAQHITAQLEQQGAEAINLAGRLSLAETAAVMQRAAVFVGADSGLAHLAVAFDRAAVVLFGPSDPLKWGTAHGRHAIVRRPLPCSPCFIFGYHKPCRSIACMRSITAAEVLRACEEVIGR